MNNENLGAPALPRPLSARVSTSCWNLNTVYATKGGLYLWHCRCTGDIHRGFRSGPTTGRKTLQKGTARTGWSSGGDGI